MGTEVELKAWVDNPEAVRRFLRENSRFEGSYVKEDTYFCRASFDVSSEAREEKNREALFRLREQGGVFLVTYKEKSRSAGVEVNREYEFTVSDPRAFKSFAEGIGFTPCITKRKEGELFSWGRVHVELSFVEFLGWFIEIEDILDSESGRNDAASVERSKRNIRSILKQIGIEEECIEERYYIDMLRTMDRSND
ncbi:MAG: class IV adenylate cyclase [Spirochaetaceae bacterium]